MRYRDVVKDVMGQWAVRTTQPYFNPASFTQPVVNIYITDQQRFVNKCLGSGNRVVSSGRQAGGSVTLSCCPPKGTLGACTVYAFDANGATI